MPVRMIAKTLHSILLSIEDIQWVSVKHIATGPELQGSEHIWHRCESWEAWATMSIQHALEFRIGLSV